MKVEVDIPADLLESLSAQAVKKWLDDQISYLRFRSLSESLQKAMAETDVDWDAEF